MAFRANPFLERMSERTTTDQEFVRLFSPKILDRLAEDVFEGAVHIFRSPPGGGKTTILRAFTRSALRAFWNARHVQELDEAYQRLMARKVLDERDGPQLLGVLLSCASGYADLPAGMGVAEDGLFRALLDCRLVLRSLRSLAALLGVSSADQLEDIQLEYDELGKDLKAIPASQSVGDLLRWAEQRERHVYARLDSVGVGERPTMPADLRFEGVLWLQSVRFVYEGKPIAPKRLLMVDDLHRLRRRQRTMLIGELTEMRPAIPVWLAERSIALGDELLLQGAREGRDVRHYALEDMWGARRGTYQFVSFAQNILDRRLNAQSLIPPGAFSQYLSGQLSTDDIPDLAVAFEKVGSELRRYSSNPRYTDWLANSDRLVEEKTLEALRELYVTRILLNRDEAKRQLSLDLVPLSTDELEQRDSSQVEAAAEIFMNQDVRLPYYFGLDRVCVMAWSNVEELLALAAALYEGLRAKQVLRKPDLLLSPLEEEKLLRDAAKRKRDFIPKNNTEGTRAQFLLDAIGSFCREKTFVPSAPYAPGVTGVRLSQTQLHKLLSGDSAIGSSKAIVTRVLAECVAENLLIIKASAPTTSREGGTVFYLNRTLCAHFGLPLQMGGSEGILIDQRDVGFNGTVMQQLGSLTLTGTASRDWFRNRIMGLQNSIVTGTQFGAVWRRQSVFQLQANVSANWAVRDKNTVGDTRILSLYLMPMIMSQHTGLSLTPLASVTRTKGSLGTGVLTADMLTSQFGGRISWRLPPILRRATFSLEGARVQMQKSLATVAMPSFNLVDKRLAMLLSFAQDQTQGRL